MNISAGGVRPSHLVCLLIGAVSTLAWAQVRPAAGALPPDVNPATRSRFPPLARADMQPGAQRFFDKYSTDGVTSTPFYQRGPQHMYVYSPAAAETLGYFVSAIRQDGVFNTPRLEIAILVAARETDQSFVWAAHEILARNASVDQRIIDAIKRDLEVSGFGNAEALIIRYGRQLFREKKVSPELFAAAVGAFGHKGVVELTAVMGYYVSVGMMLNAADQQLPPNTARLPARTAR